MENWLEIVIGLYLLAMVLYGYFKGLIRMVISIIALAVTFVIANIAMPHVAAFVKNETPAYQWVLEGMEGILIPALTPEENPTGLFDELAMIENMNLPREIQKLLIENNNRSMYESLGVQVFTEYICNYLAGLIVNAISFIGVFVLVYVMIHIITHWLNLMAKLPFISGINRIAGAALGGLQGLVFFWIFSLIVTIFSGKEWAETVIEQLESSSWLSLLFHYNPILKFVLGLFGGKL